ncbi:hypothetical protein OAM37_00930 [bacterium]|nr:hypothetical protein [bacterium]MDC0317067.1 hypothetical protein [bacterium]
MALSANARNHWLLYAMGGGMGHITRATALARGLLHQSSDGSGSSDARITLLTNSSFADGLPIENELGPRANVVRVDSQLSRDKTVVEVQRVFMTAAVSAVVVDTFPRGIAGELAEILPNLNCPKVLVHRDLNPSYCQKYRLSDFVKIYDRLIVPGEAALFESFPNAVSTPPWLIRNAEELLKPEDARCRLAVKASTLPVAVVLGCGRNDEIEQMHGWAMRLADEFTGKLEVRFIVMKKPDSLADREKKLPNFKMISIWPFFEVVRGASIVISGGGYNSVNESKAAGIPFCGVPRKRLYDRQENRLSSNDCVERYDEVRSRVERIVLESSTQFNARISFRNGVQQAVVAIQSVVN